MFDLNKEELDIYGHTILGKVLSNDDIEFYKNDLCKKKEEHIAKHSKEKLIEFGEYELLRNVGKFDDKYLKILESDWFNNFINIALNEKAIVHGFHGILTTNQNTNSIPLKFHRDAPWMNGIKSCILILIPLVDFVDEIGPTEFVPSTHIFKEMPSKEFMEKNYKKLNVSAGTCFAMDGTLWHRAGKNKSKKIRPLLQLNVQLAFLKQQIDVWHDNYFEKYSEIIKQRLGYNVRSYKNPDEMLTNNRKWKSGNYYF